MTTMLLKTPGFDAQVTAAAARARGCSLAADAIRIAATLDGMVPEQVGRAAMGLGERVYTELAESQAAGFVPSADPAAGPSADTADAGSDGADEAAADGAGDLLMLTETGRLRVVPAGTRPASGSEGAEALGTLKWQSRPQSLGRLFALARDVERLQFEEVHRWLAQQDPEAVRRRIDATSHALVHMAPVLLYVGDRCYSNLGRFSNLPGRSMAPDAEGSVLTVLRRTPAAQWSPEDAVFVVCLHALISSGSPVRAEEFNGVQLAPDLLAGFLRERIGAYGAEVPEVAGEPTGAALDLLAAACAAGRARLLDRGAVLYREINGASLHKRERIMPEAPSWDELPRPVADLLAETAGRPLPADAPPAAAAAHAAEVVGQVVRQAAPAGFTTPYEGFLHRFFATAADALDCDVAMGRGPRSVAALHSTVPAEARVALATRDFYCCVAPGRDFADRFAQDRAALARTLSAYSARMRYNTWHYLPHTMSWTEQTPRRDDWFFAPMTADITNWSDQHHTGHVTFGVRHALRVPLGIVLEGAYRPGLYDLRLLRTTGDEFELPELRAAMVTGRMQALLHQAAADRGLEVGDFDNGWYRDFHGA
ncbi:hypothetical protein ACFV2Q_21075 [Streptomyces sp. NPDC059650]|uniref:hypothetical protein n=1 Tax=Streptomyces sp. NPDC059650 TaxID=3346896 RepID=UPI00368E396D